MATKNMESFKFEGMLSRSVAMWDIFETIEQVASSDANVLILGATGTGKELIARALHKKSERKGRFVALNCSAVPEGLIDSELFGHVRGAFTGAETDKKGLFRYADNGTLFLDEIANMPLPAQYHLLRVLQENKIRPVGGHEEIPVNARVIAATSQPIETYLRENRFREDLLYRLDVIRLELPSLLDRPEDIVFLFHHFIKKFAKTYQLPVPELSNKFLDSLLTFDWPGNVRQLQNIAERMVLTHPGQKLMARHFFQTVKKKETLKSEGLPLPQTPSEEVLDYQTSVVDPTERWEADYFIRLLKLTGGKINAAAEHSGVNRRTLLRKIKKYGIDKRSLGIT